MRVLFVCTGNICRSPTAEAVFRDKVHKAGLSGSIQTDSAGTAGWHTGEAPDPRAQTVLGKYGIEMNDLKARQLRQSDYTDFDILLAMDQGHFDHMIAQAPSDGADRIKMFLEPVDMGGRTEVPDPYYGDLSDYELAYRLIEPACEAWLAKLSDRLNP